MGEISIDRSKYVDYDEYLFSINLTPHPFLEPKENTHDINIFGEDVTKHAIPLLKKNSNEFDIYFPSGKIETCLVPVLYKANVDNAAPYQYINLSCTMLDDDLKWESLVRYHRTLGDTDVFFYKVFDDDGTEILSGDGYAYYAIDLNNTYVVESNSDFRMRSWRFRTNLSSNSKQTLAKAKSSSLGPLQILGQPDGNYRVSLSHSSGNQINFRMFDMLGRCVFTKRIANLTSPVTFTIPDNKFPNSPFITKVDNGSKTMHKKHIPVK